MQRIQLIKTIRQSFQAMRSICCWTNANCANSQVIQSLPGEFAAQLSACLNPRPHEDYCAMTDPLKLRGDQNSPEELPRCGHASSILIMLLIARSSLASCSSG